jgi:hypothetical protein
MDFNEPSWEVGKEGWGGKPRTNPTEHPLWKKHVTFIKVCFCHWHRTAKHECMCKEGRMDIDLGDMDVEVAPPSWPMAV